MEGGREERERIENGRKSAGGLYIHILRQHCTRGFTRIENQTQTISGQVL